VVLVEFAGVVDEHKRGHGFKRRAVSAIAVVCRLGIQPFRQYRLALIDRASALRLILFIDRKRRKPPVDGFDQFGVQSFHARTIA
jgi:hypothetical protein